METIPLDLVGDLVTVTVSTPTTAGGGTIISDLTAVLASVVHITTTYPATAPGWQGEHEETAPAPTVFEELRLYFHGIAAATVITSASTFTIRGVRQ